MTVLKFLPIIPTSCDLLASVDYLVQVEIFLILGMVSYYNLDVSEIMRLCFHRPLPTWASDMGAPTLPLDGAFLLAPTDTAPQRKGRVASLLLGRGGYLGSILYTGGREWHLIIIGW